MESYNRLSRKNLIGFSFGAIPTALLAVIFYIKYIELFYDKLKLDPALFILGQIIYLTINSLNDPLSGHLSDRTNREKWGSRRLIYIRYGGPIWCCTMILVFFPWSYTNQWIIFTHYVLSICAFDTMLSLVLICWLSLLPEMTESEHDRNIASFWSGLLGFLVYLPFFVLIVQEDPTSEFFRQIIVILAIISSIFLVLVSVLCEEREEFQKDEVFTFKKSLKEALKSKAFRYNVGYNFCNVFINNILLSFIFIYMILFNRISPTGAAAYIFFSIYFIVGFTGQITCVYLRDKWGMWNTILIFGTLRIIGTFVTFILILNPAYEWFLWFGVIWLYFFNGSSVFNLPTYLLTIDEDETIHGIRREGIFMGISALLTKPAASLGPITAIIILGIYGYQQGATSQPESAYLGIKIILFIIPMIASAISLIFMLFYPLHGKRLEEMQKKLDEIHRNKQRAREKLIAEKMGWLNKKSDEEISLGKKKRLKGGFPKFIAAQMEPLNKNPVFIDRYKYSNYKILLNNRNEKYAALIKIRTGHLEVESIRNEPKKELIKLVEKENIGYLDTYLDIFLDIVAGKISTQFDYIKKILTRKLKVKNIPILMILRDLNEIQSNQEN